MNTALFKIIRLVYLDILRPLVVEKIQQSDTHIDDFVLSVLDKLFDANGTNK